MSSKKQALGKGLDALLGQNYSSSPQYNISNAGGIYKIAISQIKVNPKQPRKHFDEEKISELAESIKEQGVIQAITVRMIKAKEYELISGERRLRASILAGLKSIPAFVKEISDKKSLELALVENIQREDLNAIEIAQSYQQLIEESDSTIQELAAKVGKNRTTVNNYLRLLKLSPQVQVALRDGQITMGHARALINLSDNEKVEAILNETISKNLSVRQVEKLVNNAQKAVKTPKPKPQIGEKFKNYNKILEKKFNNKVSINIDKKGKGKITLNFKSDDELESIIKNLLDE
jgi:ParB family chromosome partitioning protein